jgi:hypothetical protein
METKWEQSTTNPSVLSDLAWLYSNSIRTSEEQSCKKYYNIEHPHEYMTTTVKQPHDHIYNEPHSHSKLKGTAVDDMIKSTTFMRSTSTIWMNQDHKERLTEEEDNGS